MSRNPASKSRQCQFRCVLARPAALALGACSHNIEVRTIAAPDAILAGRSTFLILPTPPPRGGSPLAANDPMRVNPIAYDAIRDEIRRAFDAKGYVYSPGSADLAVAYYASASPV